MFRARCSGCSPEQVSAVIATPAEVSPGSSGRTQLSRSQATPHCLPWTFPVKLMGSSCSRGHSILFHRHNFQSTLDSGEITRAPDSPTQQIRQTVSTPPSPSRGVPNVSRIIPSRACIFLSANWKKGNFLFWNSNYCWQKLIILRAYFQKNRPGNLSFNYWDIINCDHREYIIDH